MAYRSPGRSTGQRPYLTAGRTRSTAQIQRADFSAPVDRQVDRPDTESRALWSCRPAGQPAHCAARRAQLCASRSTARSTGLGAVDRAVDRPGLSASSGSDKQVKIIDKNSFILTKNSNKLVLTFYIEIQTCDKNFKTYLNI